MLYPRKRRDGIQIIGSDIMKVYLLLKETYCYNDNEFYTDQWIFKDKQSAMNYLTMLKENILEETYECLSDDLEENSFEKTEEGLQKLYDTNQYLIYSYSNDPDYFFIDIEDWGYEKLDINEENVMEFII